MPRPVQAREVALLKGANRKHPERYRTEIPASEYALDEPPGHLDDDVKDCWRELERYSLKGVLTGSDRLILELTAVLLRDFRNDPSGFPAVKIGHLRGALGTLGMTPSDRQKLGTEKPKQENPFNGF